MLHRRKKCRRADKGGRGKEEYARPPVVVKVAENVLMAMIGGFGEPGPRSNAARATTAVFL